MCGETGQEHGCGATDVIGEPQLVEMIAVNMRDVEEIGRLDTRHEIVGKLIVSREDTPRAMESRKEPRIAHDGNVGGLDEDSCMTNRGCLHVVDTSEGKRFGLPPERDERPRRASRFSERVKGSVVASLLLPIPRAAPTRRWVPLGPIVCVERVKGIEPS